MSFPPNRPPNSDERGDAQVRGEARVLADMSYTEVEALWREGAKDHRKGTVAVVPTGSTEAHGPHLPLATDSIISTEMARQGCARLAEAGYVAVRFPTLHYAVTDWAGAFKGSASLSTATAEGLVLDTALAAHRMGFDHVVLTNAHLEPDNIAALRRVTKRYAEATGKPLLFPDVVRRRFAERLTDEFRSGSCHAGQYETSLVLAVAPELVNMDAATALPELVVPMHEKIRDGAQNFMDCGMTQAYCGNPAGASAEEGRATFEALAQMVVDVVVEAETEPKS